MKYIHRALEMNPLETQELARLLTAAGAPRIFWPSVFLAVDMMLLGRAHIRVGVARKAIVARGSGSLSTAI